MEQMVVAMAGILLGGVVVYGLVRRVPGPASTRSGGDPQLSGQLTTVTEQLKHLSERVGRSRPSASSPQAGTPVR